MQPMSRTRFACLAILLAALMLVTRLGHVDGVLHLPDASMAVFFLGGLFLRSDMLLLCYLLFAVSIDGAAISHAGVSPYCVTAAYAFLLPAYAALWYGGRLYSCLLDERLLSWAGALGAALVSSSLSFAISNGSFYWLGGRIAHPTLAGYLESMQRWGPMFVGTTLAYVAFGLLLNAGAQRLARRIQRRAGGTREFA